MVNLCPFPHVVELDELLASEGIQLAAVHPIPLSPMLSAGQLSSHPGSSAGGYADFVLRYLASTLYDTEMPEVIWKTLR